MIKLVILDFDGTLADTRELIVRTNQKVQSMMGYPIKDEATIVSTIGLTLRDGILAMYPQLSSDEVDEWMKTHREVLETLKTQYVPTLFPHVKESLEALTKAGFVCTVASSRGRASLEDFLRGMGIGQYFSYVLGAEDVSKGKPDPEAVIKTLRDLSCDPSEAIVVGDMPVDVQMGLGAGAWTCGVTYGNSSREALLKAGAHHAIDDFGQLITLPQLELQA